MARPADGDGEQQRVTSRNQSACEAGRARGRPGGGRRGRVGASAVRSRARRRVRHGGRCLGPYAPAISGRLRKKIQETLATITSFVQNGNNGLEISAMIDRSDRRRRNPPLAVSHGTFVPRCADAQCAMVKYVYEVL